MGQRERERHLVRERELDHLDEDLQEVLRDGHLLQRLAHDRHEVLPRGHLGELLVEQPDLERVLAGLLVAEVDVVDQAPQQVEPRIVPVELHQVVQLRPSNVCTCGMMSIINDHDRRGTMAGAGRTSAMLFFAFFLYRFCTRKRI